MKHEAHKVSLPITVPFELHDAMVDACGEPFAISYLCGAMVSEGFLMPRTIVASERLLAEPKARQVIQRYGLYIGRHLSPHEREDLK